MNTFQSDHIAQEIRHQMYQFIEAYGQLPTHFDGHQHIHIIPTVAKIIAEVMAEEFGIYKTRIPNELFPIDETSFNAY